MKPKIICHIMSSVDGRLLDERWTAPFDGASKAELLKMHAIIGRGLNTDAWMFGKNTVKAFFPKKFDEAEHIITDETPYVYISERHSERMFIVADPEGDIRFTSSTLRGDNILVILGLNVTEEYLAFLRETQISYIIVDDATNLQTGFEAVAREFGIRSVSVQGGGILNGSLLNEGLIDELSLVVYPGIDGLAGVPSVFEYIGDETDYPGEGQRLQLLSIEQREHGIVWLRYEFHKN